MDTTSRRRRRVPLVAAMVLSLAFAAVPVAADSVDDVSLTEDPSSGLDRAIQFQSILCEDYPSVRGNTGEGGVDATARPDGVDYRERIDRETELPIRPYDSVPDGCVFTDDFIDFKLSLGTETFRLSSVAGVVNDVGITATTAGELFEEPVGSGALNDLNIEVDPLPATADFGALQCYRDARNPDNLEIVSVGATTSFTCIFFMVGDLPPPPPPPPPTPTPPPPPVVVPETEVLGDQQVNVERGGQSVTASGPAYGDIRVVFGPDEDEVTDAAVTAACDVLVDEADGLVRLAQNVVVIDPTGFEPGDEIEVTTLVPATDVEQAADWSSIPTGELQVGDAPRDASFVEAETLLERVQQIRLNRGLSADPGSDALWVERILTGNTTIGQARTAISAKAAYWSADAYGVCFAGEKAEVGSLAELPPLDGTALFGPVLLSLCTEETGAPCIDTRTRDEDGNVVITYRIPAEDPWMR